MSTTTTDADTTDDAPTREQRTESLTRAVKHHPEVRAAHADTYHGIVRVRVLSKRAAPDDGYTGTRPAEAYLCTLADGHGFRVEWPADRTAQLTDRLEQ